jgi:tetratricopeptide (TPR) repeat protein
MAIALSDVAVSAIYEHGRKGREAWQRGELAEAESHFLAAWDVIPEPKVEHDYTQSLSRGLVTFYKDTGQFDKATKWLEVARRAYGPEPDLSVEFLAATVFYDAGDLDAAFAIFDHQYKKFGKRPFEGSDKKYLDFYKQRAAGG